MTATVTASEATTVRVLADAWPEVLTPEALALLGDLHRTFEPRRQTLMQARVARQEALDAGVLPDFRADTKHIREGDWTIARPAPADLQDRRVEITGPVERKMVINALNSGAKCFMADFEDSSTPTWDAMMQGQINMRDAVAGSITYTDPTSGKNYALGENPATLIVRPRGWHLMEKHLVCSLRSESDPTPDTDSTPMAGGLVDAALYVLHNHAALKAKGSGPYFYLPKMQAHEEAALWSDVFIFLEDRLGLARGTIRCTVLIEHLLAAFEADEILHALREHIVALNCGRWDYIFSYIKTFRNHPDRLLPDRSQVTMTVPFMRAYSLYVIKTCHRRGAHAMGGMAAQIPIKNDPEANDAALAKVKADKEREARDGHDGTWVAHPALVPIAMAAFDAVMPDANQVARQRDDVETAAADLIAVPEGTNTLDGLRGNINVGLGYMEAWLRGIGCVPWNNLMEDAATAEISRAQVWQELKHGATLDDGTPVTRALVALITQEELDKLLANAPVGNRYADAAALFLEQVTAPVLADFLTLAAYDRIVAEGM